MTVDDIDLRDIDRFAREGPPYEWFRRMREQSPVHRHPGVGDGPGFWAVLDHEHVTALGRIPDRLSSDAAFGGITGLGPGDELQEALQTGLESMMTGEAKMLLTMDPPEHTEHRALLRRAFTPRSIAELETSVRELTGELLDRAGDEPIDFTTDIAMPLPMQVIGDLMGADRSAHADLLRWSNEALAGTDPEYAPTSGSQLESAGKLTAFFQSLREDRTLHPRDDLIGRLLEARIDGEPLSDVRYMTYMLLLAVAGNETTRNALSHGIWALADHPDQWQRLRDDPALIPAAVEEILRWASPLLYFRRNAIDDMEVGGVTIRAGDLVSLWYASANRDDQVFSEPDVFDVGRSPNHHVAFGGGGPHFCLGASLARLEIRILLEELVARFDRIERLGEPVRLRSNLLNGVKHLPVRLSA